MGRDLFGKSEPIYKGQREERGMKLSDDMATRIGQIGGTIGNDLTQDSTRGLWWLLNAPQATGNVVNEYALSKAQPDLFAHDTTELSVPVMDNGKPKTYDKQEYTEANRIKYQAAVDAGLISKEGIKRKGVGSKDGVFTKRRFDPGDVASLAIPTGVAINAGIGLLNPFGGSGGYSAALPSKEDPSKTDNAILEVAAKYILGRTGNLLPYDEFSQHRPDVSQGDYNRYKAFKYDKETDLNVFDDGKVTLPTGVAKFTTEGIHGPELQFLGKLTCHYLTYSLSRCIGWWRCRCPTKRPIKGGLIGGLLD